MTRDSAPVADRAYAAVKREVLSGKILPGERLDVAGMSARHAASMTPIRAALYRLAGEGLVMAEAGEGFHAPRISEASLRDLYDWNSRCVQQAWLLAMARRAAALVGLAELIEAGQGDDDTTVAAEGLFAAVGRLSDNEQCALTIASLNDRLHSARRLEYRVFPNVIEEVAALASTLAKPLARPAFNALAGYHRRRMRGVPDLVRMLHRPSHGT